MTKETNFKIKPRYWGEGVVFVIIASLLLLPKLGVLDFSITLIFFVIIFAEKKLQKSNWLVIILAILLSILVGNFLSALLNQDLYVEGILKPIRNIIIVFLLYKISEKIEYWEHIFNSIGYAGLLNSIVVLFQYVGFIYGHNTLLRLYPVGETADAYRVPGLSSGFPSSAVLSAISASIFLFNYYLRKKLIDIVFLVFCLPGCFLSARTGLILFLGFYILLIFYSIKSKNFNFIRTNLILLLAVAALGVFLYSAGEVYFNTIYIMFEFAFVFFDEGQVGIRSTDDLLENHYFLPESLLVWVLGNSKAPNVEGGVLSDTWLTQNLMGSGVVVVLLYVLLYSLLFFLAIKTSRKTQRVYVTIIFSFVLIASVKGSFLFSRFVGDAATICGIYAAFLASRHGLKIRRLG